MLFWHLFCFLWKQIAIFQSPLEEFYLKISDVREIIATFSEYILSLHPFHCSCDQISLTSNILRLFMLFILIITFKSTYQVNTLSGSTLLDICFYCPTADLLVHSVTHSVSLMPNVKCDKLDIIYWISSCFNGIKRFVHPHFTSLMFRKFCGRTQHYFF